MCSTSNYSEDNTMTNEFVLIEKYDTSQSGSDSDTGGIRWADDDDKEKARREMRLELKRMSARERRKRTMREMQDLQETVTEMTQKNKFLRQKNESIKLQIRQLQQRKIAAFAASNHVVEPDRAVGRPVRASKGSCAVPLRQRVSSEIEIQLKKQLQKQEQQLVSATNCRKNEQQIVAAAALGSKFGDTSQLLAHAFAELVGKTPYNEALVPSLVGRTSSPVQRPPVIKSTMNSPNSMFRSTSPIVNRAMVQGGAFNFL